MDSTAAAFTPPEPEQVRTTIVGGRPPGNGRARGAIPRGVEVLVKKAAVDPAFRARLLKQRAGAAQAIGLQLTPGERAMLAVVPAAQLQAVIGQTHVHARQVALFRGTAAAVMLAALSAVTSAEPALAEQRGGGPAPTPPMVGASGGARPHGAPAAAGNPGDPASQPAEPRAPAVSRGLSPALPRPTAPAATQPAATQPTTRPAATQPTTQPADPVLEAKVAALVKRLGDDEYTVREQATKDLIALGRPALPGIERWGAQTNDAEVKHRLTLAREAIDPALKKPDPEDVQPQPVIIAGIMIRH